MFHSKHPTITFEYTQRTPKCPQTFSKYNPKTCQSTISHLHPITPRQPQKIALSEETPTYDYLTMEEFRLTYRRKQACLMALWHQAKWKLPYDAIFVVIDHEEILTHQLSSWLTRWLTTVHLNRIKGKVYLWKFHFKRWYNFWDKKKGVVIWPRTVRMIRNWNKHLRNSKHFLRFKCFSIPFSKTIFLRREPFLKIFYTINRCSASY